MFWTIFTWSICLYGSFTFGVQLVLGWDTVIVHAASPPSRQDPSAAGGPTGKWESSHGEKSAFQQLRTRRALHIDHEDTQNLWAASVKQRLMSQTDKAQRGGKGQCWVSSIHQRLYQLLGFKVLQAVTNLGCSVLVKQGSGAGFQCPFRCKDWKPAGLSPSFFT